MKSDSPPPPPPEDDDVFHLDLPLDDAADESEKEAALRDVLDLASGRKPSRPAAPPAAKPPVKPPAKAPAKAPAQLAAPDPDIALDVVESTPEQERLKAAAVREVVEAAARITRAVELAKPMESYRARPIVLSALAMVALLLSLYTFAFRPEWVFGPKPASALTARGEAHLRFAMFLVAQRLYAFRDSSGGQLPRRLSDIREDWPEIVYRRVDDATFELRAAAATSRQLVFRSDEDPSRFLGDSPASLRIDQP